MEKDWSEHDRSSPAPEAYEKGLAGEWRKTGCAADGAPYVLWALLDRLDNPKEPEYSPFGADSPEKAKLAAAFLAKDCAGARGLSEDEITKLKAIRDRAPLRVQGPSGGAPSRVPMLPAPKP